MVPTAGHRPWPGRLAVATAWAALGLAVVTPPHGGGLAVCWIHAGNNVPCPGCGLTRSLGCAVRGMFAESWHFHPFGGVLLLFFAAVAATSLLPAPQRDRVRAALGRRPRLVRSVKHALLAGFVAFGVVRAVLQATGLRDFGV